MGQTPDRRPGPLQEEEVQFDDRTADGDPTTEGAIRYAGGSFRAKDSAGVFDLRAGSGLSEAAHRALRQLIHFLSEGPAEGFASGAYKETTPTGPFPTSEVWWESVAKLKKIVSLTTTWTGALPTAEQWKVYDVDGVTVLVTVTDSISYSGVFETSRTRTIA